MAVFLFKTSRVIHDLMAAGKGDKVGAVLAKILGDAPEILANTRDFLKQLNDLIHYYLDKFGPYVEPNTRNKLAKLALEADRISLEVEALWYEYSNIEGTAKALAKRKELKHFQLPEDVASGFTNRVYEVEEAVQEFYAQVLDIINELIRIIDEEGIR